MRWYHTKRIACSPEDRKEHDEDGKRDEIDHTDCGIWDGASDSGSRIRLKSSTKVDMGEDGEAYAAMVSYLTMNGEPKKYPTY